MVTHLKGLFPVLSVVVVMLVILSCATIMHGTSQDIGFSSTPTGARVVVDNQERGKTPVIANLSRKDNHIVKIDMPGYQPFEATITRSVSGWVLGNILFGGLIGLVVDAISGGLYKLTPEQVAATLAKEGSGYLHRDDALYIAVVLKVDPTWEKVGSLEPLRSSK